MNPEPARAPAHFDRTPRNPNQGSLYRPLCSCGWAGGGWQTYADALLQVNDHIRHPEGVFAVDASGGD